MPEPKGELHHVNPFTLLVAVVLSAQATDAGVNKATPALFALADTPEKMVGARRGSRARADQDHRAVPHQGEERHRAVAKADRRARRRRCRTRARRLQELPGVGRKTANVVLNIAFGQPTMAVDTHIFRIGNRTGLAPGKDPLAVELKLLEVIPEKYMMHAHHWLILHGRYTCLARRPLCEKCVIADLCKWPGKTVAGLRLSPLRLRTSTRRCDSRLCMCTIIAMANNGVARLTIGIDTNIAISRPARKICVAIGAAHRLGLRGRAKAHRGEQEIFPAEQIGVGEEHDDEAEPGDEQERHRDRDRPGPPAARC